MADVVSSQLGGTLAGFSGLGSTLSSYFMYFVGFIVFAGIFGVALWFIMSRKAFAHKITVYGKLGNMVGVKWRDRGKLTPIGKAGDKLLLLKKSKRFLPPPTIQSGVNEWLYWEREDGELINIGIEDLDKTQKKLGIKFIDTDMRMSRLGIEKNLAFRLQKEGFWAKYGDTIIQVAFYVVVGLMLIVLFIQWRKAGEHLTSMGNSLSEMAKEIRAMNTGQHEPANSSGSGLIPAMILLITTKFKLWRLESDINR